MAGRDAATSGDSPLDPPSSYSVPQGTQAPAVLPRGPCQAAPPVYCLWTRVTPLTPQGSAGPCSSCSSAAGPASRPGQSMPPLFVTIKPTMSGNVCAAWAAPSPASLEGRHVPASATTVSAAQGSELDAQQTCRGCVSRE